MKAWGDSQKVEDKIFMAADPYCEFTKSIGADIDRFDRGQGTRSARYTMLVENNIATKIKAEEDTATCEMSAAENFLDSNSFFSVWFKIPSILSITNFVSSPSIYSPLVASAIFTNTSLFNFVMTTSPLLSFL